MHPALIAASFQLSRTALLMCGASIVLFAIALWTAWPDGKRAHGLDKAVALSNLCFAIPLAAFGTLHFAEASFVVGAVPSYMPWPLFWAYFVGAALLAASLSIATKIQLRWSGALFGVMLFLFAALSDIPGALSHPRDRFGWAFVLRELSFSAGGWCLAASAMRSPRKSWLIAASRIVIAVTALYYGVEHFLHPIARPGLPLEALMPEWIPARPLIGYLTGAILLAAGAAMLLAKKTRLAAACLGAWIVLLVVFIYGPILIASLLNPDAAVQLEGINYFFDTLLFAGAILALANATPSPQS